MDNRVLHVCLKLVITVQIVTLVTVAIGVPLFSLI